MVAMENLFVIKCNKPQQLQGPLTHWLPAIFGVTIPCVPAIYRVFLKNHYVFTNKHINMSFRMLFENKTKIVLTKFQSCWLVTFFFTNFQKIDKNHIGKR